jgi:hypothetical protein
MDDRHVLDLRVPYWGRGCRAEADRQVLDGWPGCRGVAKAAVLRLTDRC